MAKKYFKYRKQFFSTWEACRETTWDICNKSDIQLKNRKIEQGKEDVYDYGKKKQVQFQLKNDSISS